MAHTSGRVAVNGVELHYEIHGAGSPLVMLHGWGFSGRFFDGSVDRLAEHAVFGEK